MEQLALEVEQLMEIRHYYSALIVALTIPDICSATEHEDGRATGARYATWCDQWMPEVGIRLEGSSIYALRCGMVHQGRGTNDKLGYSRILFTFPRDGGGIVFHRNVLNDALNLDVSMFCNEILTAFRSWRASSVTNPIVIKNMERTLRLYPDGLAPFIEGVPILA